MLLGVSKFSTNDAVKGELGLFAIMIRILSQAFKFNQRLRSISKDTLVSSSYDHSLEHVSTINSYSWLSILKQTQDKLDNATTMTNLYSNIWLLDTCRSKNNKLINYSKFKNSFILEKLSFTL